MNHIARDGEPEYAVIYRNRSGMDAMEINYGIAVDKVDALKASDKESLIRVAEHMLAALRRYCNS